MRDGVSEAAELDLRVSICRGIGALIVAENEWTDEGREFPLLLKKSPLSLVGVRLPAERRLKLPLRRGPYVSSGEPTGRSMVTDERRELILLERRECSAGRWSLGVRRGGPDRLLDILLFG